MKKHLKYLLHYVSILLLIFCSFTVISCGDDDDDNNNPSSNVDPNNTNANIPDASNGYDKAVLRTEFPRLKSSSKVIVYRTSTTTYDKDRVNFAVEWDSNKRTQRWTCYQMHKGYSGSYSRKSNFYFDTDNLSSTEYWGEFKYFPGYDRGHICPSGDRTASKELNSQTFVMTNMQPQYHKFNGYDQDDKNTSGLWLRMENIVRTWASKLSSTDTLFICKGGTIDKESDIITRINGKMIVPRYFYMAILRKSKFGYAGMAFWSEQKDDWRTSESLRQHAISIADLENKTGIEFFCNLPDKTEKQVKNTFNPSVWSDLDTK